MSDIVERLKVRSYLSDVYEDRVTMGDAVREIERLRHMCDNLVELQGIARLGQGFVRQVRSRRT